MSKDGRAANELWSPMFPMSFHLVLFEQSQVTTLFLVPEYGMVVRESEKSTREDLTGGRQMTQVSTDVMV